MAINTLRNVKAAAPVSAFARDLFTAMQAGAKADLTMRAKLAALLAKQYGDVSPTFEQFTADRAALKSLSAEKGLADDQYARKTYNAAVKAAYKDLPVSMSAAAVAKRAARPGKAGKPAGKTGPVKGETAKRVTTTETLEQMIARVGIPATLDVIASILKEARETADAAKVCSNIARELQAPVKKAA